MEQVPIPCTIMRGGTSKGVFIRKNDLPSDPAIRNRVVLAIFGSPDIRQINGLGGADPLTSKLAVIGPASKRGCDCDYIFAQVDIHTDVIIWDEICGNIVSAVGPFAIDEGLVEAREPVTRIKINCPNLKIPRTLTVDVPVTGGSARTEGDYHIDGVPGTGAKIAIDWADMAGASTGRLLPTGNARDVVAIRGIGAIEVSMIDCPNLMVYCRARDFGLHGTEGTREIDANQELINLLLATQKAAGTMSGVEPDGIVAIADPDAGKNILSECRHHQEAIDFSARQIFMGRLHKTLGGSVAANSGVAARIPGTVIHEIAGHKIANRSAVRIGHPAGSLVCESEVEIRPSGIVVSKAVLFRTFRRIMDGYVYVPTRAFAPST